LPRIEEAGVRIERLEHAFDRAVDEALGGNALDVLTIDRREGGGEDAIMRRDLVLSREDVAAEQAAGHGAEDHRENRRGKEPRTTHLCIVTDKYHGRNDFRRPDARIVLTRGTLVPIMQRGVSHGRGPTCNCQLFKDFLYVRTHRDA
jgi:hypothetical protein